MRKLLRIIAFTFALLAGPVLANAQTLAAMSDTLQPPSSLTDFVSDIQNMPTPQIGAILGGGVIGGVIADNAET